MKNETLNEIMSILSESDYSPSSVEEAVIKSHLCRLSDPDRDEVEEMVQTAIWMARAN